MAELYKVGFVGTGGISRGHAQRLQARDDTEVAAACDMRPDAVAKFAEEFSVERRYTCYRDMLAKEALDIVCVCTWPNTHAAITIAAARAGAKGVLCEKPMCIDLAEADTMLLACKRSGTKLVVSHQRRFEAGTTKARELIAEGAIGKPSLMRINRGGGLTNSNTHAIDTFRYILGDPATLWVMGQVERTTDRWERCSPIEDLCLAHICFEGGARAIIESDMPPSDLPENSMIFGTEGILGVGRNALRLLNAKVGGWQEIKAEGVDSRTAQIEDLIRFVEGDIDAHRTQGEYARAAMEIMMAVYESARRRALVHMPLDVFASPLEVMIESGALPVTKPGRYDIRDPWWFDEMREEQGKAAP